MGNLHLIWEGDILPPAKHERKKNGRKKKNSNLSIHQCKRVHLVTDQRGEGGANTGCNIHKKRYM
jgi:hypothetical protein